MKNPKVSIVIPCYNHYDLLHQALFDLYSHGNRPYEIVVVNDASTDKEFYDGLTWWESNGMFNIKEIRNTENMGFLSSSNFGLKEARGDIIALLSNDVRVRDNIVNLLVNHYKLNGKDCKLIGGRLLDFDTGWNRFGDRIFHYLEGWLLIATRESWEELKYLDDRFAPSDYEDIDLSTTALKMGYTLIPMNNDKIHHMGGQSYGYDEKRKERTEKNRKKFEEKWSLLK